MSRAVIYLRVSTEHQDDNFSLAAQLGACQRYAEQNELTITATVQDVMSGARLDRPGLTKVRELIASRVVDLVLVFAADRWTRSVAHYLLLRDELRAAEVKLIAVNKGQPMSESPEGGLFETIETAFGEYEREKLRQRSMIGRKQKVIEGKHPGHGDKARYGYRFEGQGHDKTLVIVEEEATIIRHIFTWHVEEGQRIPDIARRLTEQRVPTPADRGRTTFTRKRGFAEWNRDTIYSILRDPIYAGSFAAYRRTRNRRTPPTTWISVAVPAIVEPHIWQRAQELIDRGRQLSRRNNKSNFYLLRCRIRCTCGYAVGGTTYTRAGGKVYRYYRCFGIKPTAATRCMLPHIPQYALEDAVWGWIVGEVLDEEKLLLGLEQRQERSQEQRERLDAELSRYYAQRAELDAQAGRLAQLYTAGIYTLDEIAAEKQRIDKARTALTAEIATTKERIDGLTLSAQDRAELLAYAGRIRSNLETLDPARRRRVVDLLNVLVVVSEGENGEIVADTTCELLLTNRQLQILLPAPGRCRC